MYGVPQGLIVGQKLFLCILMMPLQILHIYYMLIILVYYAQIITEKTLYTKKKNLEELQTWFTVNKLSLSIEKTNNIIFSNKRIDK